MEIIFIVARENEEIYNNLVAQSLNKLKHQCLQIGDKPNSEGKIIKKSITEKYNISLSVLKDQKLATDDKIFIYCHEDVNILDNLFIEKVNMVFEEKPEIGILGVVGVENITEHGWLYDKDNKPKGHLILKTDKGKFGQGNHKTIGNVGYYDNVIAIDNCIFAIRGTLIKDDIIQFDIENFSKDRNMYAMDICMQCLKGGYKVAVADILVFHNSLRNMTVSDEWIESKKIFNNKYKDLKFPININSFKIDKSEVMSIEI